MPPLEIDWTIFNSYVHGTPEFHRIPQLSIDSRICQFKPSIFGVPACMESPIITNYLL